jgi:hypothetical protein
MSTDMSLARLAPQRTRNIGGLDYGLRQPTWRVVASLGESARAILPRARHKRERRAEGSSNCAERQSLVAACVDAAPTDAIVGIAAESICLVNVIRVAVRIARVSEYPRHLACGKRICLLDRHEGNVSTLGLASGGGAGQRDANRNPQTVYSSHRAPPARLAQQRMAPRSNLRPDICWFAPMRPDRNSIYIRNGERAWRSRRREGIAFRKPPGGDPPQNDLDRL